MDAYTETEIARGLAGLYAEPTRTATGTIILFTTSPPLLEQAGRVAYVEDGRVCAVGEHHELLAGVDGYRSLVVRGENVDGVR